MNSQHLRIQGSPRASAVRQVALTWSVLTPMIITVQWITGGWLSGLAMPIRVGLICAAVVPVMSMLALPAAMRLARPWLTATRSARLAPSPTTR